ncbi:MAG: phage terminase large subunit [Bacteroidetes bacterium]|nr:phage terminase large subunit [Bacteroidota bacterium]
MIEKSSSGIALIQELRQTTSLNVCGIPPLSDTKTRMLNETPAMEAGRVHYDQTAAWVADFQRELVYFPNAKHDDQVDSVSQFLYYARVSRPNRPIIQCRVTPIISDTDLPNNLFSSLY